MRVSSSHFVALVAKFLGNYVFSFRVGIWFFVVLYLMLPEVFDVKLQFSQFVHLVVRLGVRPLLDLCVIVSIAY